MTSSSGWRSARKVPPGLQRGAGAASGQLTVRGEAALAARPTTRARAGRSRSARWRRAWSGRFATPRCAAIRSPGCRPTRQRRHTSACGRWRGPAVRPRSNNSAAAVCLADARLAADQAELGRAMGDALPGGAQRSATPVGDPPTAPWLRKGTPPASCNEVGMSISSSRR